jgi:hypothetical protein
LAAAAAARHLVAGSSTVEADADAPARLKNSLLLVVVVVADSLGPAETLPESVLLFLWGASAADAVASAAVVLVSAAAAAAAAETVPGWLFINEDGIIV